MTFYGIDRCDRCGGLLEERGWLHGVCEACRASLEGSKRSERVKPG